MCVRGWEWNKEQRSVLLLNRNSSEQVLKDKKSYGRLDSWGGTGDGLLDNVDQPVQLEEKEACVSLTYILHIAILSMEQMCRKGLLID